MSPLADRPKLRVPVSVSAVDSQDRPLRPDVKKSKAACSGLAVEAFVSSSFPRQRQQSAIPAGEQAAISVLASN
jgi:hypothetical protein